MKLKLVLCALMGVSLTTQAQIFQDKSAHLGGHAIYLRTMDVQAADLNKDGYLDLVLAVEWAPNAILWGNSKGTYEDSHTMRLSRQRNDSEDIAIADFDGNGFLDLVFAAEDDMNHEYYLNFGNGKFENVSLRLPKFISNAVQAHDFNGDGHIDLIFGNQGQNRIFINDGTGKFKDETELRLPKDESTTQDIALIDFDNDGDMDLIIGNEEGNFLWMNQGRGFFKDITLNHFPSSKDIETRKVTVFDANKDGFMDVFLSNVDSDEEKNNLDKLYLNDGKGRFIDVSTTHLPQQNLETLDAVAFDFDGDGDLDLVLAHMGKVQPSVLINDGTGKFTMKENALPKISGNNITVYAKDFNYDGKMDLYFGGFMTDDNLLMQH